MIFPLLVEIGVSSRDDGGQTLPPSALISRSLRATDDPALKKMETRACQPPGTTPHPARPMLSHEANTGF
jgi:hypothetical protein